MVEGLTVKEYQNLIKDKLMNSLGLPAQTEWRAMQKQPSLYSPRVDVAAGPFIYDESCKTEEHDSLVVRWEKPIEAMLTFHKQNVEKLKWEICRTTFEHLCNKNKVARCFIAVEIENGKDPKHLIGDIFNAIALGRLGVVIPWSIESLESFGRIRKYFWFLSHATNFDATNLLILDKKQFVDILNSINEKR